MRGVHKPKYWSHVFEIAKTDLPGKTTCDVFEITKDGRSFRPQLSQFGGRRVTEEMLRQQFPFCKVRR